MFVEVDNNSGDNDICNPKKMAFIKHTDCYVRKTYIARLMAATLSFAFIPNATRNIRHARTVE